MKLYRSTIALGAASLLTLALALYLTFRPAPRETVVAGKGEPAFPGFAAQVEEAAEIRIAYGETETTLVRSGDGWGVAERSGYPADGNKPVALLRGIARARKIEPKSADPERFAHMGLGDEAVEISVRGRGGAALVEFDAGRQFSDIQAGGLSTYILAPAAERAWTVSALPFIDPEPAFWLAREVIALSPARVKRVRVRFGDQGEVFLSRTRAADFPFEPRQFEDMAYNQARVNALAFALSSVIADDVAKADGLDLFRVAAATFTTFDGLIVTATFYDSDGVVWTSFEAAYDPAVLEEEDTPALLPDVPRDGAAEAARLNGKWQGWVYRLPLQKVTDIMKREEELVR